MSFHDRRMSVRQAEEAARIAAAKARGRVPEACGPEIPEAPARDAFRLVRAQQLYPDGEAGYVVKDAGFLGRAPIQSVDVFDVMDRKARAAHSRAVAKVRRENEGRKKEDLVSIPQYVPPFTSSQIAMGRHYRDLVERHACAGLKCSSVEGGRIGGGGQGGDFMDAVLADGQEIDRLRRRIGCGVAMEVRRVRPSERNRRGAISDRQLVDMVCLGDLALSDVLRDYGWAVNGRTVKSATKAVAAALDRMAGPVRRRSILTL